MPVYAACMAAHIIEGGDTPNLQMDRSLSPRFDKPLFDESGNLHPNCPLNLHIPHSENIDSNEGCESEARSLISERNSYYFYRIQNADKRQFNAPANIFEQVPPEVPVGRILGYDPDDYTICSKCNHKYYNRKQVCDGSVACGLSGPLIKVKLGKIVGPEQATITDYGSHTIPSMRPLCATKSFSRRSVSSMEIDPPIESQPNTGISPASLPPSSVSSLFLDVKRKYNSKEAAAEDYSVILEALYPKDYNPSGHANIAKIFDLIGADASVEGFVPNAIFPWREFSCDLGAAYLNLIDENRETSKYGNLSASSRSRIFFSQSCYDEVIVGNGIRLCCSVLWICEPSSDFFFYARNSIAQDI